VGQAISMDFDWSMVERPSAMAMVRGQLGFSWLVLSESLDDLSDDEWAWEPAPGSWGVRPRTDAEARSDRADHLVGAGEWVAEWPRDDGSDDRTRTLAWLIAHLTEAFFERYEHTFGSHNRSRSEIDKTSPFGHPALHMNRELIATARRSWCCEICTPRAVPS
jgi:hypothetical protein